MDAREAVRGCLLGLLLGDAVGVVEVGGAVDALSGPLLGSSGGQLACFTVEGVIRAQVRSAQRGFCHPPSVVWNAYRRWAAVQGIPGVPLAGLPDPDGWLIRVPALRQRRGSAPATVRALQRRTMGTVDTPVGHSVGAHGLIRSLPAWFQAGYGTPGRLAAEIAALTHRDEAVRAAGTGAAILGLLAEGRPLAEAVALAGGSWPPLSIGSAVEAARSTPRQVAALRRLAPDATAVSALTGGLYVALCHPVAAQVRDALSFAASAGDGGHVAAVAGALLGTAYGVDALPVDWLSRLELAWVGEVLARDLAEVAAGFRGSRDQLWERYPGW